VQATGKKEFTIKCSFLEIYNEAITDLLNPETESGLKIKDSPELGVYVDGLKEETVSSGASLAYLFFGSPQVQLVALPVYVVSVCHICWTCQWITLLLQRVVILNVSPSMNIVFVLLLQLKFNYSYRVNDMSSFGQVAWHSCGSPTTQSGDAGISCCPMMSLGIP
jgi:hypothetical protein